MHFLRGTSAANPIPGKSDTGTLNPEERERPDAARGGEGQKGRERGRDSDEGR